MSATTAPIATVVADIDAGRRRARLIAPLVVAASATAALATSLAPALAGEAAAGGRLALAALGLAAAALLRARPALGYRLALAWAALQLPFVAWTPDGGSPTAQALTLPLTFTSQLTVNGATTSYLAVGVNLVGLIAFIVLRGRRHALAGR